MGATCCRAAAHPCLLLRLREPDLAQLVCGPTARDGGGVETHVVAFCSCHFLAQLGEMLPGLDERADADDPPVQELSCLVRQVAFAGWSEKDDGDRKVRQELRLVLKRYGIPASGEPFDSAYAYIKENY